MPTPLAVIAGVIGAFFVAPAVGGALSAFIAPAMRSVGYRANELLPNNLPPEGFLADALHKRFLSPEAYTTIMKSLGFDEGRAGLIDQTSKPAIALGAIAAAERRGILDERNALEQYQRHGLTDEQIHTVRETTKFFPTPNDIILWLAREVFEPESVALLGLLDDFDTLDQSLFEKAGVSADQVRNFWIAHWQHPSFMQMREMILRSKDFGIIDKPEEADRILDVWFKTVEIPPIWRKAFRDTFFQPYTRVDIRRMWDMGVLDDEEAVRAYREIGFDETKARTLLQFTKAERLLPDLRRLYANGWISEQELRDRVREIGLKEEPSTRLIQTILKNDGPERNAVDRELTVSEIANSVKKELITTSTGISLLQDLGYSETEAGIKLFIRGVVPENQLFMLPFQRHPLGLEEVRD